MEATKDLSAARIRERRAKTAASDPAPLEPEQAGSAHLQPSGVSVRRIESEEPSTRRKSGHEQAPFGTTWHYAALRGTRSTHTCSGGGLCPLFRRGVHSWV